MEDYKVICGDMLIELEKMDEASIDCIITDPPYGLTSITKRFGKSGSAPAKYGKDGAFSRLSRGFMGKEWDGSGIEYNIDTWEKCLRVLKPGGYLLAFGGSRTYHRIACAIEDAGFDLRDCIMWLYSSGFPKAMNIGYAVDKKNGVDNRTGRMATNGSHTKGTALESAFGRGSSTYEEREAKNEWAGWQSCLKPAYEPIVVARKPFKGSLVDNVLEYGVGGLNIDECRVPLEEGYEQKTTVRKSRTDTTVFSDSTCGFKNENTTSASANPKGRFPANIIHDGMVEEWSRYFYSAKASKKDRDEGLDDFEVKTAAQQTGRKEGSAGITGACGCTAARRNVHPTVKPTALMQYLIRLVTPRGGAILDPFMGSGSTGKAAMFENNERGAGYKFIGIEKDEEYAKIAEARIKWARDAKEK